MAVSPWEMCSDCVSDGNQCQSNMCVHGDCVDLYQAYACRCNHGYEGKYCEQRESLCVSVSQRGLFSLRFWLFWTSGLGSRGSRLEPFSFPTRGLGMCFFVGEGFVIESRLML